MSQEKRTSYFVPIAASIGFIVVIIVYAGHDQTVKPSAQAQKVAQQALPQPVTEAQSSPAPAQQPINLLKLLAWSWSYDGYNFVEVNGQVQNIAPVKLDSVVALVCYYTKDGEFITSDQAILKYDPVMPGQTSPFQLYTPYNPLMKRATIEFKFFGGNHIPTEAPPPKPEPKPKKKR
jgi:hypothetical protein